MHQLEDEKTVPLPLWEALLQHVASIMSLVLHSSFVIMEGSLLVCLFFAPKFR